MKRGSSGLSALVAIDKPQGMTSHDVVSKVRHLTGERRVGHAGTLDPLATGLLIVGIGPATRLAPYLTGHDKTYEARVVFGSATDTCDAEGTVIATAPIGRMLYDTTFALQTVEALQGDHLQRPPIYSARRIDGKHAYAIAREGGEVELDERPVTICSARLSSIDDTRGCAWTIVLDVSKGTYIRSIARDLGESLDCPAHLGALRRLQAGDVGVEHACTLDDLASKGLEACAIDPVWALGLERIEVMPDALEALTCGKVLGGSSIIGENTLIDGRRYALISQGRLMSIHEALGGRLKACTVIPGGVIGVR